MQKSTKSYDLELRYQSELIKKTKSISDSKKENNKENNKGDGDDIEKKFF